MVITPERTPSARETKFSRADLKQYKSGDIIVFLKDEAWVWGRLLDSPKLNDKQDQIKTLVSINGEEGAGTSVLFDGLPKKINIPKSGIVEINNKTYKTDARVHFDDAGVMYVDLEPVDVDDEGKITPGTGEGLKDVNIELLSAVEKAEMEQPKLELRAKALFDRVLKLAGEKRDKVKIDLVTLRKWIVEMPLIFGATADWGQMAESKVKKIQEELSQLITVVDTALLTLEKSIEELEDQLPRAKVETPEGKSKNLEKINLSRQVMSAFEEKMELKDAGAIADYKANEKKKKTEIKKYETDLAEWTVQKEAAKKAKTPQEFIQQPPQKPDPLDPLKKPSEDEHISQQVMYEVFDDLKDLRADYPELETNFATIESEVKNRRTAEAKSKFVKGGDYPADSDKYKEATGRAMLALMNEWQAPKAPEKSAKPESERVPEIKINFNKEKRELSNKCTELEDRIDTVIEDDSLSKKLKSEIEKQWMSTDWLTDDRPDLLSDILKIKRELVKVEIEIEIETHRINRFAVGAPELKPHEKREETVRLDKKTIFDLLEEGDRAKKLREFWLILYNAELGEENAGEIHKKFMEIFADSPSEIILSRLKANCGIRDWDHFKNLLKGEAGMQASFAMRQMAQQNLRNQVMNEGSMLGRLLAQKKYLAKRVLVTAACVGGGVLAFKAILPVAAVAYMSGAVGITAAGGATGVTLAGGGVGGFIRGFLQKKIFKTQESEQEKAGLIKKYEDKLAKKLSQEMEVEMFEGDGAIGNANQLFSGIIAQTLNEAVARVDKGERKADINSEDKIIKENFAKLDEEGQRLYRIALLDLRKNLNGEPSQQQRVDLMIGLMKLREMMIEKKDTMDKKSIIPKKVMKIIGGVITQGYTGEWAAKEGMEGIYGHAVAIMAGSASAYAMSSSAGRFAFGFAGGFVGGTSEAKRKMELKDVKEGELLLKQYLNNFDKIFAEGVYENILMLSVELKSIYKGDSSGNLKNQKVANLLRTSEFHRTQVRERLDKADNLILEKGLVALEDAGKAMDEQAKKTISKFEKYKKDAREFSKKVGGGVWRGVIAGGVAVATGELASWASHTDTVQNSVGWMQNKLGISHHDFAAKAPVVQESRQVVEQTVAVHSDVQPTVSSSESIEVDPTTVHKQEFGTAHEGLHKGAAKFDVYRNLKPVMVEKGLVDAKGHVVGTDKTFDQWGKDELRRLGDFNADDLKKMGLKGNWGHGIHAGVGAKAGLYADGNGVPRIELGKGLSKFHEGEVRIESGTKIGKTNLAATEFGEHAHAKVPKIVPTETLKVTTDGGHDLYRMNYKFVGESGIEYTPLIAGDQTAFVDPSGNAFDVDGHMVGTYTETDGHAHLHHLASTFKTAHISPEQMAKAGVHQNGSGSGERIDGNKTLKVNTSQPDIKSEVKHHHPVAENVKVGHEGGAAEQKQVHRQSVPELERKSDGESKDKIAVDNKEVVRHDARPEEAPPQTPAKEIHSLSDGREAIGGLDYLNPTEKMILNNFTYLLGWQHELYGQNGSHLPALLKEHDFGLLGKKDIDDTFAELSKEQDRATAQFMKAIQDKLPMSEITKQLSSKVLGYTKLNESHMADNIYEGDLSNDMAKNSSLFRQMEVERIKTMFNQMAIKRAQEVADRP